MYRYVSISSIASNHASSRENLTDKENSPEYEREGEQDDVFSHDTDDENHGEKRLLETSLYPKDKKLQSEITGRASEKSPNHERNDRNEHEIEFMETTFMEETVMTEDIDLNEAIHVEESLE